MKKFLLALAISLIIAGTARAEGINIFELIQNIPEMKQGVAYSISDSQFNYCMTLPLVEWNDLNFEAGYIAEDELIGAVTYKLLALKDYVSIPILDLIECNLGAYAGGKRLFGDNPPEFDWGVTATLINIKF